MFKEQITFNLESKFSCHKASSELLLDELLAGECDSREGKPYKRRDTVRSAWDFQDEEKLVGKLCVVSLKELRLDIWDRVVSQCLFRTFYFRRV